MELKKKKKRHGLGPYCIHINRLFWKRSVMRPKPLVGTHNSRQCPENRIRKLSTFILFTHAARSRRLSRSHVFGMLRMVWWEAAGCSVMMTSMLHVFGHIRNSNKRVEEQYVGKQIRVWSCYTQRRKTSAVLWIRVQHQRERAIWKLQRPSWADVLQKRRQAVETLCPGVHFSMWYSWLNQHRHRGLHAVDAPTRFTVHLQIFVFTHRAPPGKPRVTVSLCEGLNGVVVVQNITQNST